MASAWSAPAWMKTNNALTGLGFLKDDLYQTWANYHKKFLDMYKENGIDFWAITTGNEPVNGLLPVQVFNSMGWTPGTVVSLVQLLVNNFINLQFFWQLKFVSKYTKIGKKNLCVIPFFFLL